MRRRVVVHGLVQGVGFRVSLAQVARVRGVGGWVRNCGDGTVEAALEGDAEAVEAVVRWCRSGPRGAQVTDVEQFDEPSRGEREFAIR